MSSPSTSRAEPAPLAIGAALAIVLASGLAGAAPDGAPKSWQGVVVTADGTEHRGQLLFDNTRLRVDPGGPSEKTLEFGQIRRLQYLDARFVGTRPVARREFRPGLFGEYHAGGNFEGVPQTRIDPAIDFDWNQGAPAPGIPADRFSVRWTGEVQAPVSGRVSFHASSDDGARLWIAGSQLINVWTDHAVAEHSGAIDMQAGRRYPIRVEYYDNASHAVMRLLWSGPGLGKQVVPTSHLFTDGVASTIPGGNPNQKVWLRGGSMLRAAVVGLDGKFFELAIDGILLRVPAAAVAAIDLHGAWATPADLAGRPEGVLSHPDGQFHASRIRELDAEGILKTFSPLLGRRTYRLPQVRALKFAEWSEKPAPLRILVASPDRHLRADAVFSQGERLAVRDNSGQFISLPLALVFAIEAIPAEQR